MLKSQHLGILFQDYPFFLYNPLQSWNKDAVIKGFSEPLLRALGGPALKKYSLFNESEI
jgi:hypothetical protein